MNLDLGKTLIAVGLGIALVGVLLYVFQGNLKWFGHLPGDIAIEKENFKFYFPITTLVLLNLVIWGLAKLWNSFHQDS